ncbi:GGDEF domain-containing protein [Aureimonas altamirensis]|uniref:GGDEF domain-containing protein n=1 Tax=Aureimonas altamirensis TaxID=370622 RepID=UPI002036CC82|nr:GGDEF domain-containing protein [Aureimonas altamirensis]MCM2504387.1 GGDEF domain-containing protein [Aureimonas altamirensis]
MRGIAERVHERATVPLVAWFLKPDNPADGSIVEDLLRTTSGGVTVVAFGCVCLTLQVAIYAYSMPAAALPLLILVMAASSARMLALHRARNGLAASNLVVFSAIAWASTVGLVCALCMLTGEIVLSTVAALTTTGFAFTSAYNNAGIPRLARAQVLIVGVPFLLASVFTGLREMSIILAMGPIWLLGVMHLVTGAHKSVAATITTQKRNSFLAMNDDLTGLANRVSILGTIEDMARDAGAGGPSERPYVLYLDLDEFKPINDRFGHAMGDHVLRTVAGRLRDALGASGHIGRVGGDEFVVALTAATAGHAAEVAARLGEAARLPVDLGGGRVVRIGATIGGASVDRSGVDAALARADARLYEAKRQGGGVSRFD